MHAKRVVVVGGAGFIGTALTAELVRWGHEVVVVDKARLSGAVAVDIAAPGAADALQGTFAGAAAVVHLAARVNPATEAERAAMRRLHVEGTHAVVDAARAAGVGRLVLASSATVYGAWPDNPIPLRESHARRPNPGFAYAHDKCAQEDIVGGGAVPFVIARPAIVYGPGARNYLTEIIRRAPVLPALDGHRPPLQMVHVQDVASALACLVRVPAADVVQQRFNVAPDDWLSWEQVAALTHKRVVRVPLALTRGFDALSRVLPAQLRAPRSMLPYLMHPFVVDNARLRAIGWAPQSTSADALLTLR